MRLFELISCVITTLAVISLCEAVASFDNVSYAEATD